MESRGVGTSEMALCLGRPQILLPRHLEQTLNASALQRAGIARLIRADASLETAAELIRTSVSDPEFAKRAKAVGLQLEQRMSGLSLQRILTLCETLAGTGWTCPSDLLS